MALECREHVLLATIRIEEKQFNDIIFPNEKPSWPIASAERESTRRPTAMMLSLSLFIFYELFADVRFYI